LNEPVGRGFYLPTKFLFITFHVKLAKINLRFILIVANFTFHSITANKNFEKSGENPLPTGQILEIKKFFFAQFQST